MSHVGALWARLQAEASRCIHFASDCCINQLHIIVCICEHFKHEYMQVKNQQGQWISADPIPGTFVCNIGDMLKVSCTLTADTHSGNCCYCFVDKQDDGTLSTIVEMITANLSISLFNQSVNQYI